MVENYTVTVVFMVSFKNTYMYTYIVHNVRDTLMDLANM